MYLVEEGNLDKIAVEVSTSSMFWPCQLHCFFLCDTFSSHYCSCLGPSIHKPESPFVYHVLCCAVSCSLLSCSPSPLWMYSGASITSQKSGVVWNQPRKVCVAKDIETLLIPYTRPALDSQSAYTSHSLPSSPNLGVSLYCWLIPSTMFVTVGTCQTSTMLCASTPSLHLACIADSLSFISTSWKAWQSVSTSTGYPCTISENLSNFIAANSSRKGLSFSSNTDVFFAHDIVTSPH